MLISAYFICPSSQQPLVVQLPQPQWTLYLNNSEPFVSYSRDQEGLPIVHILFFSAESVYHDSISPKAFTFLHYISFRSILFQLHPQIVYFYCDVEPIGPFWSIIQPFVRVIRVPLRTSVLGIPVESIAQLVLIMRLEILLQHGGIFIDLNTILIKPWNNDKCHTILEKNPFHGVGHGLLAACSGNPFLFRWYAAFARASSDEFSKDFPIRMTLVHRSQVKLLPGQTIKSHDAPDPTSLGDYFVSLTNMSLHDWTTLLASNKTLHRLIRPMIPFPFVTLFLPCHNPISTMNLMDKLLMQSFQLYQLVVFNEEAECLDLLQVPIQDQRIVFVHDRFQLDQHEKGLWSVHIDANSDVNVLSDLFDQLILYPHQHLNETTKFSAFQLHIQSKLDHVLTRTSAAFGEFPHLNQVPNALNVLNLAVFDYDQMFQASFVAETMIVSHSTRLQDLWPNRITSKAYRLLVQDKSEWRLSNLNRLLQHIQVWEMCATSRLPILIVENVRLVHPDEIIEILTKIPIHFDVISFEKRHEGESIVLDKSKAIFPSQVILLSPRMARLLLLDIYPIVNEDSVESYMESIREKYGMSEIYHGKLSMKWMKEKLLASFLPEPSVPQVVHVIFSNRSWLHNFDHGSPPSKFPIRQQHWSLSYAYEEDSIYSQLDFLHGPLGELWQLHFKLTIVYRYGGIVMESNGTTSLPLLESPLRPFMAYLHYESHMPTFPLLFAPVSHGPIGHLRMELGSILMDFNLTTDEKVQRAHVLLTGLDSQPALRLFPVAIWYE